MSKTENTLISLIMAGVVSVREIATQRTVVNKQFQVFREEDDVVDVQTPPCVLTTYPGSELAIHISTLMLVVGVRKVKLNAPVVEMVANNPSVVPTGLPLLLNTRLFQLSDAHKATFPEHGSEFTAISDAVLFANTSFRRFHINLPSTNAMSTKIGTTSIATMLSASVPVFEEGKTAETALHTSRMLFA